MKNETRVKVIESRLKKLKENPMVNAAIIKKAERKKERLAVK